MIDVAVIATVASMSLIANFDTAALLANISFPDYGKWYLALGLVVALLCLYLVILFLLTFFNHLRRSWFDLLVSVQVVKRENAWKIALWLVAARNRGLQNHLQLRAGLIGIIQGHSSQRFEDGTLGMALGDAASRKRTLGNGTKKPVRSSTVDFLTRTGTKTRSNHTRASANLLNNKSDISAQSNRN